MGPKDRLGRLVGDGTGKQRHRRLRQRRDLVQGAVAVKLLEVDAGEDRMSGRSFYGLDLDLGSVAVMVGVMAAEYIRIERFPSRAALRRLAPAEGKSMARRADANQRLAAVHEFADNGHLF